MTVRGRTEWQKLVDAKLNDHERRLNEHEKTSAVFQALQEEQRKYLNDKFNRVQDNITQTKADLTRDVHSIKSAVNRVVLMIISAVVLAIINFIINGGLKV